MRLSAAEILIQKKRCPQCEGHIPTARHSPLRFTLDNCKGSDYPLITLKGSSYRSEKRPTRFSSIRSQDPEPGQIICQQDLYPGNYAEGNGLFFITFGSKRVPTGTFERRRYYHETTRQYPTRVSCCNPTRHHDQLSDGRFRSLPLALVPALAGPLRSAFRCKTSQAFRRSSAGRVAAG